MQLTLCWPGVHKALASQPVRPLHLPPAQVSPPVQPLASSQATALFFCVQPDNGLQSSSVQGLPSSQTLAIPPLHLPPAHLSFSVHKLPSLHPAALLLNRHELIGSQVSVVQTLLSSQSLALPGVHAEFLQTSLKVQALPSLHSLLLAAWTQPLSLSQLSSVQLLPSAQLGATPPAHCPSLHASTTVHASPSLHAASLFCATQPLSASQLSSVQALPSLQILALLPTHLPVAQMSLSVQMLLSSQTSLLLIAMQPLTASHKSLVQGLPSSQVMALETHWLLTHRSVVQALPSLHWLLSLQTAMLGRQTLRLSPLGIATTVHLKPSWHLSTHIVAQTFPAGRSKHRPLSQSLLLLHAQFDAPGHNPPQFGIALL